MGIRPNINIMALATRNSIRGAGGGSAPTPHTPVESPDTLRSIDYFRIVDLISEGEIGGLVNGLQSVFLNGTPVANADGTLNFTGVQIDSRNGTQDQTYIPGYSSVENEISVTRELRVESPFVQSLTDLDLSAVRITLEVPSLEKTNPSNGDIGGYSIQYAIDIATDGGDYQTMVQSAFTGKTTSEYKRSHRVDLPAATTGWLVRVRRLTANANSATIADTTQIVSYTEIIDAKLRYPNSALVAINGDASQFQNVPTRAYEIFGRIVQVPSNYDPTSRVYTGVWDGSLKPAWTDNPAWVFYDLYTNDRFGLGDLVDASLVDKWGLYQIAQYCDELVSDGKGGQEPRFTCNCYLQTQQDAFKMMSDIASIFRGVAYWMGGAVIASADMPADPVALFTNANVIGGKFTYQSTPRKSRFTEALVTWNDPSNAYNQATEPYQDQPGMARYGLIPTSSVAVGCTSQGQANRAGHWITLSSQLETDSVSFQVGLDGLLAGGAPGAIIAIQDQKRARARQGGRISTATATTITVDRAPDVCAVGDTLQVMLPSGTMQIRTISAVDGRNISVSPDFSAVPVKEAQWAVESEQLALQYFSVRSISEDSSDTAKTFTITAAQHEAQKFAAIDNGTIIQTRPISRLPPSLQPAPATVTVSSFVVTAQGIAQPSMHIAWDVAPGASYYKVEWQKDLGQWIQAGTVATASLDVQGVYTGSYIARVTAFSSGNVASLPTVSAPTDILGKTGTPPALSSLTTKSKVYGIEVDWGFPDGTSDTQRTEIWQSTTNNRANATKLGDFAYPGSSTSLDNELAGSQFWFWGRIVDKAGNVGAWYPDSATGGVNGQASSDQSEYDAYFSGLISKTALGGDLLSDIELISPATCGDADIFCGDDTVYCGTWSQLYAQQTATMATAQRVDTVEAVAGSNSAIVQQTAQTVADLNGRVVSTYSVKLQVTSGGVVYGAGMGIGIEQDPDGSYQSQVLFQADRFGVINVINGQLTTPFVIQGGQTFISQALIGAGWITNAMIGNQIMSTSVNSSGLPTWIIDKSGTITLHGDAYTLVWSSTGMVMSTVAATPVTVMKVGVLSP
jgi:predicted phage tail protein